ncbi:quinol dehydrogenase ferredoxin subunit NapH [Bradyrhizobium sp. GCM10027634]|uniref:quinol dehydrogenase ferredoxin subunit NapH n=1 Tax=unclassified Bradyrhizobium TaxID=2631580 RepID=UPI00263A3E8A|nr:quinol dehydrogenase ferredoxin subunit NapH [Bradyrhizobium sp. WYCCWR 12677]MDN4999990.1 quinol dehydrogenase ferredoxin subunit NapH [Bradyrhizobium sp. WYCCWR 12677]
MTANARPYVEARAAKGLWAASRFLVLRRTSQLFFLALFLSGPLLGIWIAKGTLASSMTLGTLPLTDPFVFLQSLAARHWPEGLSAIGAAIVLASYLLFGGRTYCFWVCPVNPVTDLAAWLRRRLGITVTAKVRSNLRLYFVGAVLAASALSGSIAWELINPVTALHRALVFGLWFGAGGTVAIFIFDLLVVKHGWCGHLCPIGAFYGQIGKVALLRITADNRAACNDCMDCFAVCPEPHVISPALNGERTGATPVITAGDCTLCGACIDVCSKQVFHLGLRGRNAVRPESSTTALPPAARVFSSPPAVLERDLP